MIRFLFALLFITTTVFSQTEHLNTKKGIVAKGYDVVAYFSNTAVKGKKKLSTNHNGATYRFSSEENLKTFKENPDKYVPQYGGYCAYAIGVNGEKVDINPKTFEIRDGKLYLFYNSWGTNTLKLWLKEDPKKLKEQADKNWSKITN
ncbi:YHS domain-containing (seleno)protein [uncultured Tenacibaculum sp.]|uniref:YHS domain-containing (seleno)protein n=1 Tax=uncultured Tenacibaculum sp. TaxID=174713 RepID=UPI00260A6A0B|nr:YHS domain-containing (seleno)protein [uncultured Tenacibaculum sp.]